MLIGQTKFIGTKIHHYIRYTDLKLQVFRNDVSSTIRSSAMIKYGRFMGTQNTELAFPYFEFKLLTFPQSQMSDAIDSL